MEMLWPSAARHSLAAVWSPVPSVFHLSTLKFVSPQEEKKLVEGGADVSRSRQFRILIVDDHEALRRGLKSAVTGAGWQVCGEAANGKEAIDKTLSLQPDLVILDLSMPVMGGFDAAREIRRSAPKVKLVVFTMHESQQVREETTRIGVHALAVKSAPLTNLLDTIRQVLAH
jgi:CheY-like chemotaxis protein